MNGAAAMSVEMCEVTEMSSAEGIAASTTQRAAFDQVGWDSQNASATVTSAVRIARSISMPHHAISTISNTSSTAWKNTIATDHTEGEPPSFGSTILVNIGCTANSSAAERKIAAA